MGLSNNSQRASLTGRSRRITRTSSSPPSYTRPSPGRRSSPTPTRSKSLRSPTRTAGEPSRLTMWPTGTSTPSRCSTASATPTTPFRSSRECAQRCSSRPGPPSRSRSPSAASSRRSSGGGLVTGLNDTDIKLTDEWQLTQAADGDAPLCSGLECLYQNIALEAVTQKGDLFYDIDFGWSLYDFIQSEDDELTGSRSRSGPGSGFKSGRSSSRKQSRPASTTLTTPSGFTAPSSSRESRSPGSSTSSSTGQCGGGKR